MSSLILLATICNWSTISQPSKHPWCSCIPSGCKVSLLALPHNGWTMMGNGEARCFLIEDEASGSCGMTFTSFTPKSNSVCILPAFCSFFLLSIFFFAFTFAHMLTEVSWPCNPYINVFATLGAACSCYIVFDLIL